MRRTFREFLFLLTGAASAAVWFSLLLAGWLAVLLLAITPLVVPALVALRWATRGVAIGEAALARELLGVGARVPAAVPTGRGYLNRIRGILGAGDFWRQQSYGLVRMTAGFAAAIVAVSAVGASLYLIGLPMYYRWVDQWQVHTLGRAFVAVPAGIVALGVSVLLVRATARAFAAMAPAMLGAAPVAAPPPAERDGLREHAAAYGAVGLLCVVVWALTTRAYFWPMWPLLGLAMPLAVHALAIHSRRVPRRWRAVAIHGCTLAVIAIFLVAVWVVTTRGYFWPMWPILAFVLTAGAHALAVGAPGRRRAELKERIGVLETTRAGAVDAAETELRRIERDLHDGAQARLVAVGMSLGLAEQRLGDDPEAARRLLEEARTGAEEALRELRDLARGIHPPVLTDRGLEAALASLAARSPLPVDLDVDLPERPPAAQETVAYFVAAEALTNATKHAAASCVAIRIRLVDGKLVVRIEDDGRGGADSRGRGLRGLAQRVEALDGRLHVGSPAGGPTVVEAVMTCEP